MHVITMKGDFHAKIFPMSGHGLFGDTEKPDSAGFRLGKMILQFVRFFPLFQPSASWDIKWHLRKILFCFDGRCF